jgi:hypothetical protein
MSNVAKTIAARSTLAESLRELPIVDRIWPSSANFHSVASIPGATRTGKLPANYGGQQRGNRNTPGRAIEHRGRCQCLK